MNETEIKSLEVVPMFHNGHNWECCQDGWELSLNPGETVSQAFEREAPLGDWSGGGSDIKRFEIRGEDGDELETLQYTVAQLKSFQADE